jgi:ABC-2 type transport system ATP-binding protein
VADDRTENLKQSGSHTRRIHLALQNADPADAIATLNMIDGITATASAAPDTNGILGLTLTCRGTDDPRPAVYAAIKATDWILVEFVQQTKNLETIFRELTKEN